MRRIPKLMKLLFICFLSLSFLSCTQEPKILTVKQSTLRDLNEDRGLEPLIRHEKLRRLYGSVSMEERVSKLGQYYEVIWNSKATGAKEIVFSYQQGGSKVKQIRRPLGSATKGKESFKNIGDNYSNKGRILAWKIDFIADGKVIASEQSYLWD